MGNDKRPDDATEALAEALDVQGHGVDDDEQDYSITITGGTCL